MTSQSSQNVTHQLITNTNALNTKIDNLATTLEGLNLNDDIKQHIDQQLADIIQQTRNNNTRKHEIEIKDLERYDGESQNLRSWLTAANLQWKTKELKGTKPRIFGP